MGFVRFQIGDVIYSVADDFAEMTYPGEGYIIIDRLVVKKSDDEISVFETRFKDSVSLGFNK